MYAAPQVRPLELVGLRAYLCQSPPLGQTFLACRNRAVRHLRKEATHEAANFDSNIFGRGSRGNTLHLAKAREGVGADGHDAFKTHDSSWQVLLTLPEMRGHKKKEEPNEE